MLNSLSDSFNKGGKLLAVDVVYMCVYVCVYV